MGLTQDRRLFYDRLKYTIIDSEKEELDEMLRTLIRKDNSEQIYREIFDGCYIDGSGEIVREGFFSDPSGAVSLTYAMYTLLAYGPEDFPLKREITSIRFIAPEGGGPSALRFPRRLDLFPRLEQLGLVGWDTAAVPRELASCTRLKYLSLRNNRFSTIPEPVLHIPGLTHLDCSFNLLEELPHNMDLLSSLETLSLKGNKLSSLPPSLGRMASLKYLDISCNRLTEFPPFLENLRGLQILNAAYNELTVEDEARLESLAAAR